MEGMAGGGAVVAAGGARLTRTPTSGGQIRILTKSGGQEFHGAMYEYLRNTELNANTWGRKQNALTNFTPPVKYNQFGFNMGGPFYIPNKFNTEKNKIFWYW